MRQSPVHILELLPFLFKTCGTYSSRGNTLLQSRKQSAKPNLRQTVSHGRFRASRDLTSERSTLSNAAVDSLASTDTEGTSPPSTPLRDVVASKSCSKVGAPDPPNSEDDRSIESLLVILKYKESVQGQDPSKTTWMENGYMIGPRDTCRRSEVQPAA